jgi:MFS family permease
MGARFIDGVFFNVFAVFSITCLTQSIKVDRATSLNAVMIAAAVLMVCLPIAGRLADRIGRVKLYLIGCLCTGFSPDRARPGHCQVARMAEHAPTCLFRRRFFCSFHLSPGQEASPGILFNRVRGST